MKAQNYIIAMLITSFIGALTVNAQSAYRRSSNERTRTTQTKERKDSRQQNKGFDTQTKNKQSVYMRTESRTPIARIQNTSKQQPDKHQYKTHQTNQKRYVSQNSTYNDPKNKHQSISNTRNPRSNYGKPASTVHNARVSNSASKKQHNENIHYYGGKHYHHAYPTRKVRTDYHYDTYRHNYRVLYYPTYMDIYWTRSMYRDYVRFYPSYTYWHYSFGHRIATISAFKAQFNLGEVARVYGRVYATWYNKETDDLLLFFGGDYPQQNFTMVIPGNVARRYSWRPERYFLGLHITATGLITSYEGKPEMVIKQKKQISLY